MLTDERLAEIRKRWKETTYGNWSAIDGTVFADGADEAGRGCFILWDRSDYKGPNCNREADSQFVGHAKQDLRDLLAEIEELKRIKSSVAAGPGASPPKADR